MALLFRPLQLGRASFSLELLPFGSVAALLAILTLLAAGLVLLRLSEYAAFVLVPLGISLGLFATGRIDTVSPVLCAHERTVLPIADKLAARLFKKRDPLFVQKHYNELFPLISLVEDTARTRPP